jgi:hypothetical protein
MNAKPIECMPAEEIAHAPYNVRNFLGILVKIIRNEIHIGSHFQEGKESA